MSGVGVLETAPPPAVLPLAVELASVRAFEQSGQIFVGVGAAAHLQAGL